jgi:hypothetical protein
MGTAPGSVEQTIIAQNEARDAFGELYETLRQAYWVAGNIQDKDRLTGLAQAVYEIRMALDASDIKARTDEYATLASTITALDKRLQGLQADLDHMIHNLTVADQILKGITKAITAATACGFI